MEVMSACERAGIRVHVAGVFGGEVYSIFRPTEANKPRVARWQALANKHAVSLVAIAVSHAIAIVRHQ
jgi:hypothetical protein